MALSAFSRGAVARARVLFSRVFPPGIPVFLSLLAVLVTVAVLLVPDRTDPAAPAANAVTSADSTLPVAHPGPGSAVPGVSAGARDGDPGNPDAPDTAPIVDESAASTGEEIGRVRADGDEAGPGAPAALAETAGEAAEDDGDDSDLPELAIAGAVLDDRGHLLPGIIVAAAPAALPGGEAWVGPGAASSGVTDANGMFRIEGVAEGEYDLSVAASALYREARLTVRAGVESAELRLQRIRAITVRGQVTAASGQALPNVSVRVLGEQAAMTTDPAGRYEVVVEPAKAGQPPVLAFTLDGYRESRQRVNATVATEADTVELNVRLEPSEMSVALTGSILGRRSEPVPGARVWLSSPDPVSYRQTTSDERGEYRFDGVEIGDFYRAGVEPVEGYEPHVSEPFAVGPDDTVHSIHLAEGGDALLSGRLVDPEGKSLAGFALWLEAAGESHMIQSDGNGDFSTQPVPSGTLTLHTQSQPLLQATGIELLPGESRHVLVPLDWGSHWLFGLVVDQDARPVAGARIVLQWSQQFPDVHSVSRREVSSDRLGYFTFSNLGAGDHVLTVTAPGYGSARNVYDPRFAASEIRVALQRSGGSGTGGGE